MDTHITASEIATLGHKSRNHTMELALSISEALFAGAERSEVLGGLRHVGIQLETNTAPVLGVTRSFIIQSEKNNSFTSLIILTIGILNIEVCLGLPYGD